MSVWSSKCKILCKKFSVGGSVYTKTVQMLVYTKGALVHELFNLKTFLQVLKFVLFTLKVLCSAIFTSFEVDIGLSVLWAVLDY